jgi:hypothetical protein
MTSDEPVSWHGRNPGRQAGQWRPRCSGCFGEGDLVTQLGQLAGQLTSATLRIDPLSEVIPAQVVIRLGGIDDVVDDHQNRMRDRDRSLLLTDTPCQPPKLRAQIVILGAGSGPGGLNQRIGQPLIALRVRPE